MADTKDVDIRHLGAEIRGLVRRKAQAVREAIPISVRNAAKIIRANTPEAFGDLKRSVEIQDNEVVVNAPYAVAVEVGSRPHTPPLAPLIAWAEQVGANNPEGMAKAVQLKIQAEGTRPRWFVRGSIPEIMRATGESVNYKLKK